MQDIEDRIQELLREAAPLRGLDADDPLSDKLARIVDEINRHRAIQERETRTLFDRARAREESKAAVEAEEQRLAAEENARLQADEDDMPSRAEMEAAASRMQVQYRATISDPKLFDRLKEAGWDPEEES